MYVIVAGGGKIGFYLARELVGQGHEVLVIEKSAARVEAIANDLGNVVLKGNADEASVLGEAGANRADVVCAVTGDDEDNLVICQVAKRRFSVPRTIARINNPKNEDLFRRLGIDTTISATNVIHNLIEQLIPQRHFVHLMTLRHGDLAIVEGVIPPDSPVNGRTLAEIPFPTGVVIAAVLRGPELILPTGATRLRQGDEVVAVTKRDQETALRELLLSA